MNKKMSLSICLMLLLGMNLSIQAQNDAYFLNNTASPTYDDLNFMDDVTLIDDVTPAEILGPLAAEFNYEVRCSLTVTFLNTSKNAIPNGFTWDFGDGTILGQEHPTHTYQEPGIYTVVLDAISQDGRIAQAKKEIHVDYCQVLDVNNVSSTDFPVNVFPNPSSDKIYFSHQKLQATDKYQLNVYNTAGQAIVTGKDLLNTTFINVNQWKKGIYWYNITNKEGQIVKSNRFVVQ